VDFKSEDAVDEANCAIKFNLYSTRDLLRVLKALQIDNLLLRLFSDKCVQCPKIKI
jgi:hypothetical protein